MSIKLHPFSNGQKYGYGKLRSLFDFFFPELNNWLFGERIRCEGTVAFDSMNGVTERTFYTFRNFAWHYFGAIFIEPIRNLIKKLESIRVYVPQIEIAGGMKIPTGIHFAVAFDNAVYGLNNTNTFLDWTQTTTGSNLFMTISTEGDVSGNADNITSATWDSAAQSLTKVTSTNTTVARWIGMWYLNGANAVTNGHARINQASSGPLLLGISASYSGAQKDTATAVTGSQSGASSQTLSITPVADNCWVHAVFSSASGENITAGAGTQLRQQQTSAGFGVFDNNAAIHPAASTSLVANWTAVENSAGIIIAIAPFAPAVTKPARQIKAIGRTR